MAEVRIENFRKQFPDGTVAVHELDLTIADGELFVLLGPSGCGKTTTLRCVGGLEHQTEGDIVIGDEVVNDLRPADRDIAMVFQFYALYPHMTSRENIAFPLKAAGASKADVNAAVDRAARIMKIEHLLDRKPSRLSGGEQQRVALGRALVREPQVFLMDEPLTNLDAELRVEMRTELRHLQATLRSTMIHVTHDQTEAMSLGHRIGIMSQGRMEQVGTPLDVYRYPRSLFVARFIGSPPMNIFPVEVRDGALAGPDGLPLPLADGIDRSAKLVAGVRPEALELVPAGSDGATDCRVLARDDLGDETIYVVEAGGEELSVRTPPQVQFAEEAAAGLRHDGSMPCVYDTDTERAVSGPDSEAGAGGAGQAPQQEVRS